MAAPTTRRPAASLVALGNFSLLVKSLTVIRPDSRPASSTSGSFSTLCALSRSSAASLVTPPGGGPQGHRGHPRRHRPAEAGLEPDVAVRHDAEQDAVVADHRHAGD